MSLVVALVATPQPRTDNQQLIAADLATTLSVYAATTTATVAAADDDDVDCSESIIHHQHDHYIIILYDKPAHQSFHMLASVIEKLEPPYMVQMVLCWYF